VGLPRKVQQRGGSWSIHELASHIVSTPLQTPPRLPGAPGFVERRRPRARWFSRWTWFGGRRRNGGKNQYVDSYGLLEAVVMVGVLLLNLIDIGATLFFVQEDIGTEVNPVAIWLMSQGAQAFIWAKSLGVGSVLLVLVVAKNFFWARFALWITIVLHSALAVCHTYTLCMYLSGRAGPGGI
jgi:hypothetical protein